MKNNLREHPAAGEERATVDFSAPVHSASAKPASIAPGWPGKRIFWIGDIARPTPTVMAVVDAQGDLVPVHTAGALLRHFKTIWRATEA